MRIVLVTRDRAAGEAELKAGRADVLVIAPEDPEARFRAGEQSVIEVRVNAVDPVEVNYAGEPGADAIPPEIVAAPTRAELMNIAPSTPGVISFFGPAVLALILQHLAVTLVALSLVRERTTGVMELFRIAPVSVSEILAGKVLAFGFIGSGVAAVTITVLVHGFGVPMLAGEAIVAATIVLLLVASLGLGLLIAVVSDSERQAVQLSLLVLIASVFFSGFVLPIDEFTEPVRDVAYTLPVTHGIRLLQDLLLRGGTTEAWEFLALAAIAIVTLLGAWAILRRSMTRA